ncbi:MAG: M23 family metallopeptidase [Sarcina sp.]
MGKYDKVYENYYKKLDSDNDGNEREYYYDEARYVNNKYGKRSKNSTGGIVMLIAIPILVLGGLGIYKFAQTKEGKEFYSSFIATIEEKIEFISGNIDKKYTSKDKEDKEDKDEVIKESVKAANSVPSSFVLNENNVERVKSDKKYNEVVSALNGIDIKAKSEQGLVLSCKYKIIATSLSGIVEEVGENADGHFLVIDHGNNIKTLYYNLPKFNYVEGQAIKKGEAIAEIKDEKEIIFKIKENDEFITPSKYLEFI